MGQPSVKIHIHSRFIQDVLEKSWDQQDVMHEYDFFWTKYIVQIMKFWNLIAHWCLDVYVHNNINILWLFCKANTDTWICLQWRRYLDVDVDNWSILLWEWTLSDIIWSFQPFTNLKVSRIVFVQQFRKSGWFWTTHCFFRVLLYD